MIEYDINKFNAFIETGGYTNAVLVADKNTLTGGGEIIEDIIDRLNINLSRCIYGDNELIPDEQALGRIFLSVTGDTDLLIALGSGTINDLCRYTASRAKLDYISIPTAASMDGYASSVAPLIVNGRKVTYPAVAPVAIFPDCRIYKTAPVIMTAAGFGDVIGKYTSLTDWKLGSVITGEEYDEKIAEMTRKAATDCFNAAEGLKNGDEHALISLMEALLLSGTAMKLAGSSRPASGAEHHLAHFYEAAFLERGAKPVLHGIKVAQTTMTVFKLHELLLEYGSAAATGIYKDKWQDIQHLLETGKPDRAVLKDYYNRLSCPLKPTDIGVDRELFIQSVLHAKEIRPRYTVLQLCSDLGLLEKFADIMADEYYSAEPE